MRVVVHSLLAFPVGVQEWGVGDLDAAALANGLVCQ